MLTKLSAEVAALPKYAAPALSIIIFKIILNRNMYKLLTYKMKPEAAILKSRKNGDFQDWVYRARVFMEKAAGTDSNGVCHIGHLES